MQLHKKSGFSNNTITRYGSRRLNPFEGFLPMSHTCSSWKVGSSLFRIGKGPAASAARAAGFGCFRRPGCAAVTDPPAAH